MSKICKQYFYPEAFPIIKCGAIGVAGKCNASISTCTHQMNLTPAEYAILDNFRIIKTQNMKILADLSGEKQK